MFRTLLSGAGHHARLSPYSRHHGLVVSPQAHASARGPGPNHLLATGSAPLPFPGWLPSLLDSRSGGSGIPGDLRMFPTAGGFAIGPPALADLRLPWESLRGRRSCWRFRVPLSCGWFTGLRHLSISVIPRSHVYGSICRVSRGLFGTPYCTVLPDLDGSLSTVGTGTIAVFHQFPSHTSLHSLISTRACLARFEARSPTDLGQMTPDYRIYGWSEGCIVYVGSGPPSALVGLHAEGLRLAQIRIYVRTYIFVCVYMCIYIYV